VHELSLALEDCRQAEQVLEREGGGTVRRLAVEIGDDAGLERENFRFCLESLLSAPPFNGTHAEFLQGEGPDLRLAWVEVDDGRPDD
jgi:Zn finger protein HypA/HybF involved in hydrogenase expression